MTEAEKEEEADEAKKVDVAFDEEQFVEKASGEADERRRGQDGEDDRKLATTSEYGQRQSTESRLAVFGEKREDVAEKVALRWKSGESFEIDFSMLVETKELEKEEEKHEEMIEVGNQEAMDIGEKNEVKLTEEAIETESLEEKSLDRDAEGRMRELGEVVDEDCECDGQGERCADVCGREVGRGSGDLEDDRVGERSCADEKSSGVDEKDREDEKDIEQGDMVSMGSPQEGRFQREIERIEKRIDEGVSEIENRDEYEAEVTGIEGDGRSVEGGETTRAAEVAKERHGKPESDEKRTVEWIVSVGVEGGVEHVAKEWFEKAEYGGQTKDVEDTRDVVVDAHAAYEEHEANVTLEDSGAGAATKIVRTIPRADRGLRREPCARRRRRGQGWRPRWGRDVRRQCRLGRAGLDEEGVAPD